MSDSEESRAVRLKSAKVGIVCTTCGREWTVFLYDGKQEGGGGCPEECGEEVEVALSLTIHHLLPTTQKERNKS